MSTTIDAGDLTLRDVGWTVTVRHEGTTVTGPLRDFSVDTDSVEVQTMQDAGPVEVTGETRMSVRVGAWSAELPVTAQVEVSR